MKNPSDDRVFDVAMQVILRWEGGLVDDPHDPGGITKYGISLRAYPSMGRNGIKELTKHEARAIYRSDYFERIQPQLRATKPKTCIVLLDSFINQGPRMGSVLIQRAIGVSDDGIIGKGTLRALEGIEDSDCMERLCVSREEHYRSLRQFPRYGKGWLSRLSDVRRTALNFNL